MLHAREVAGRVLLQRSGGEELFDHYQRKIAASGSPCGIFA
jgi:hypothetical protein